MYFSLYFLKNISISIEGTLIPRSYEISRLSFDASSLVQFYYY